MISLAIFGLPTLPVLASLIRFDLVWGVSREWLKLTVCTESWGVEEHLARPMSCITKNMAIKNFSSSSSHDWTCEFRPICNISGCCYFDCCWRNWNWGADHHQTEVSAHTNWDVVWRQQWLSTAPQSRSQTYLRLSTAVFGVMVSRWARRNHQLTTIYLTN